MYLFNPRCTRLFSCRYCHVSVHPRDACFRYNRLSAATSDVGTHVFINRLIDAPLPVINCLAKVIFHCQNVFRVSVTVSYEGDWLEKVKTQSRRRRSIRIGFIPFSWTNSGWPSFG